MTRALLRLAGAAVAVAAAVYLVPASAHIVAWPASGPHRVALLPPFSRLWWSLAASLGLTAAVATVWARRGRDLQTLASAASPLALLLLWTLPFLPWLPDRCPLLLVLAGPLRWIIAAAAIGGTVAGPLTGSAPGRYFVATRSGVFAVSLVLYVGLGLQFASEVGLSGDEPHYLVITHSLLVDHDLEIGNNHDRRDYRPFFAGDLKPDYLRRGSHGEIYSVHAPGLPVLLLPAYALAGASGAVVMVALLAALTSLAIFDLALLVAGRRAATLTWVALCLTIPIVPHAWLIYPEVAGALVVGWSALWLLKPTPSPGRMLLCGMALALLPWLHTKFVVLLALLTLLQVARAWPQVKQLAALLLPVALSTTAWLYAFYRMYGVFDPQAPYGGFTRLNMSVENIPRGVLGLLLDQKFGLLMYSPVYALAGVGGWFLLRSSKWRAYTLGLTLVGLLFVASTTRFYMWWGGASAPARFLVPIVPLVAPMVAVAINRLRGVVGRSLVMTTLIASILIAGVSVASPRERFLFSQSHGAAELVLALQGSAPLAGWLPTFTEENWHASLGAVIPWLAALLVAGLVTLTLARKAVLRSRFWTAAVALVAFGLAASIGTGTPAAPHRDAAAVAGQLSLMQEYDPSRLDAVDYHRLSRISETDVLRAATLSVRSVAEHFTLPEGRYEARVWFDGDRPPAGDAFAALSDQTAGGRAVAPEGDPVVVGRAGARLHNPIVIPFELLFTASIWIGLDDSATAAAVRQVDIAPLWLAPQSARSGLVVRRVEWLDVKQQSYVAYMDENTFPEGGKYWTRDTRKGTVAIVPGGASVLSLILHVGPNAGRIAIDIGARREELDLAPGETRELRVPLAPATPWLIVAVQASHDFRPAEVNRESDDWRRLGCQVRPRLW